MSTKTQWTHKVYRSARDSKGQWFRLPGKAKTFGSESEATAYAESKAKLLSGQVYGHMMSVASRSGSVVKNIRID